MGVQWSLRSASYYPTEKLAALTRRAITGNYKPHGDIRAASCVIIPAFGYRLESGKITPGKCNVALAQLALDMFPDIPKFVSHEVDDALKELGHSGAYRFGEPGKYYETRAVALDTIRLIGDLGLLDDGGAAVLAHQNHMPRADATVRALLLEGSSSIVPAGIEIPWDAQSMRLRARSAVNWAPYEMLAIGRAASRDWLDLTLAT